MSDPSKMDDATLVAVARDHAQRQEGFLRRLIHVLADRVSGAPPSDSGGITFPAVWKFLRSRKVNLMGWQWKRVEGPVTMKQDGEEWVEL